MMHSNLFYQAILFCCTINLAFAQCGKGGFRITGSPAVKPIAIAWAREYAAQCRFKVKIDPTNADSISTKTSIIIKEDQEKVTTSTICKKSQNSSKIDIYMTNSPIIEASGTSAQFNCTNIWNTTVSSFIQVDVALDSISVIVNQSGIANDCIKILGGGLSQDQLRWIFSSDTATNLQTTGWSDVSLSKGIGSLDERRWSRLHASCSNDWISIGIPSSNSEYFNFFQQAIMKNISQAMNATSPTSRPTFTFKTDKEIANFAKNEGSSIGYISYSSLITMTSTLQAISVPNNTGFYISPNASSITSKSYNPLSRTLYMILSVENLPLTRSYLEFGYSNYGDQIAQSTGLTIIHPDDQMKMFVRIGSILPQCLPKKNSCVSSNRDGHDVITTCISLSDIECCSPHNITVFVGESTKRYFRIWKIYYENKCVTNIFLIDTSGTSVFFRACKIPGDSAFLDIAARGLHIHGVTGNNLLFPTRSPALPFRFRCTSNQLEFDPYTPPRDLVQFRFAPTPNHFMYTSSANSVRARTSCFLQFALCDEGSTVIDCNCLPSNNEADTATMCNRIGGLVL
jgi:ABC-type phosphate transport system substrate-binding protein